MSAPAETYPITGINAGVDPKSKAVPLRLEVDSWYPPQTPEHLRQVNLFTLALRFFQQMDVTDKLSFFQVAGIHGLPYMPWDENTDAQTFNEGYCTHGSLLFPCWHRPYVLLYEQRIYEIMVNEIIPKFPEADRGDLTKAAAAWRLPYWDWAAKKKRGTNPPAYDVPLIVKDPRIEVVGYDLKPVYVDNPMYRFTMPDGERMGCSGISDIQDSTSDGKNIAVPFSKSKGTSRWAVYEPESSEISAQWQRGEVDNAKIAKALESDPWYGNSDKISLSEMVYRLFSPDYIKSFDQFSTTKYVASDSPAPYLSLEYVHNNIHNWTGGFDKFMGHMTEIGVAGFDPIFWMHHCNVDRQFAIWQALNVDNKSNWFEDPDEQLKDPGNWSIKRDAIDTPETPLAPFHTDTKGTYFTSNDIRDWMKFYYSYPELQPWLPKYYKDGKFDNQAYLDDINKQLNELYASTRTLLADQPALRDDGGHPDYIVNVRYKKYALNGVPFTIYFFIGPVESDYTGPLHLHRAHVGIVYNFSNPIYTNPASPGCENCRRQANENADSTGQIPITNVLVAHIKDPKKPLDNLLRSDVKKYIEDNLHWRVKTHGGYDVLPDVYKNFVTVSVHAGIGEHDTHHTQLSRYHSYQTLIPEGNRGNFR